MSIDRARGFYVRGFSLDNDGVELVAGRLSSPISMLASQHLPYEPTCPFYSSISYQRLYHVFHQKKVYSYSGHDHHCIQDNMQHDVFAFLTTQIYLPQLRGKKKKHLLGYLPTHSTANASLKDLAGVSSSAAIPPTPPSSTSQEYWVIHAHILLPDAYLQKKKGE